MRFTADCSHSASPAVFRTCAGLYDDRPGGDRLGPGSYAAWWIVAIAAAMGLELASKRAVLSEAIGRSVGIDAPRYSRIGDARRGRRSTSRVEVGAEGPLRGRAGGIARTTRALADWPVCPAPLSSRFRSGGRAADGCAPARLPLRTAASWRGALNRLPARALHHQRKAISRLSAPPRAWPAP